MRLLIVMAIAASMFGCKNSENCSINIEAYSSNSLSYGVFHDEKKEYSIRLSNYKNGELKSERVIVDDGGFVFDVIYDARTSAGRLLLGTKQDKGDVITSGLFLVNSKGVSHLDEGAPLGAWKIQGSEKYIFILRTLQPHGRGAGHAALINITDNRVDKKISKFNNKNPAFITHIGAITVIGGVHVDRTSWAAKINSDGEISYLACGRLQ